MNLFSFDSVSIAFDGREILKGFSLSIAKGDKVVLRGPSGSGKSTILRFLLGFVRPDSGSVSFKGQEITPSVALEVRREVAYVPQSVELEAGTVREALRDWFTIKSIDGNESDLDDALSRVGLSERVLEQSIPDLSGGERHRIGILMGLLTRRKIFLLDEPTAALDVDLKKKLADWFIDDPAITVVASAHDPVWFEDRDNVTLVDLS